MPVAEHLVASTRSGDRSLCTPDRAQWLWEHLHRALVAVRATCIMPDHIHLLLALGQLATLRRVLTGFTQVFGVRFDILPPQVANSEAIARRMARYIWCNPLHAGLTTDPFAWPWSSARDAVGATAFRRGVTEATAAAQLHHLGKSRDFRVHIPRPEALLTASPLGLIRAASSTLRLPPSDVLSTRQGRRLIVHGAAQFGPIDAPALATLLDIHPASIYRHRNAPTPPGLAALELCLANPPLLRHGFPEPARLKTRT